MLLMEERRQIIMQELKSNGTVYVSELANRFSVTYETLRKDLTALEANGLLIKSHGGATLKQNAIEYPFQVREKENINAKKSIARKAMTLIPDKSSIIIGTGSTTLELANILSTKSGYKIFTDSLPVASVLINSDNQVFLFGGELRNSSSSVFGGWTVSQIENIQVDICFIGSDGFSNFDGPTSPSSSDAFIDQVMIRHSEKCYILADYTKFTRKSLYRICSWEDVTGLVTDKHVTKEQIDSVQSKTKVIVG